MAPIGRSSTSATPGAPVACICPPRDGLVADLHTGAQPGGTLRLVIGMKGADEREHGMAPRRGQGLGAARDHAGSVRCERVEHPGR